MQGCGMCNEGPFERFGAWFYDLFMWPVEVLGARRWREALWAGVEGEVLEIGIGTGAGLLAHPPGARVTGVDGSAAMLARAERRATRLSLDLKLVQVDLHHLPFPDQGFDFVVESFVLCSVRDPQKVLSELARVLRPGGEVRLLEHVRPRSDGLTKALKILAPHFAKATWELFPQVGWKLLEERALDRFGLVRLYRLSLTDQEPREPA